MNSHSPLFPIRALEVHDYARIWNLPDIERRLQFMVDCGLTTLVLHEPGIVDKIVFPAIYLGGQSAGRTFFELAQQLDEQICRYAIREFQNAFRHKYLTHLIDRAGERGIAVYLEDKELWFKDFVLKAHPEAFHRGFFCPSQPFWWEEFLPAKYTELFIALPKLAGVVTSFGTGETRLSLGNIHHCGCERCRQLNPTEWHRAMALGMYRPFAAAGKKLVIRDFVFQRTEHDQFARAMETLPHDIAVSIKNTPHDFYPTFPNNPLIGKVGGREQWIEYDVHGQYFGWGMAPAIMIADLRQRMRHAAANGVAAFSFRTDWEGTQSHSCFETPNLLNLYAAAVLARDVNADEDEIYAAWLTGEQLVPAGADKGLVRACATWTRRLFARTWDVVRGAMYVNGTVFSDSGTFHVTMEQTTWIAETLHSLKDWSADAADALQMREENARHILGEKDAALALARQLLASLATGNPGLTPAAYERLRFHLEFTVAYVEGFRLTTRIYVFHRLLQETKPAGGDAVAARVRLADAIAELREYRERISGSALLRTYPANALLDPDRLACFIRDAETRLEAVGAH